MLLIVPVGVGGDQLPEGLAAAPDVIVRFDERLFGHQLDRPQRVAVGAVGFGEDLVERPVAVLAIGLLVPAVEVVPGHAGRERLGDLAAQRLFEPGDHALLPGGDMGEEVLDGPMALDAGLGHLIAVEVGEFGVEQFALAADEGEQRGLGHRLLHGWPPGRQDGLRSAVWRMDASSSCCRLSRGRRGSRGGPP